MVIVPFNTIKSSSDIGASTKSAGKHDDAMPSKKIEGVMKSKSLLDAERRRSAPEVARER